MRGKALAQKPVPHADDLGELAELYLQGLDEIAKAAIRADSALKPRKFSETEDDSSKGP